MDDVLVSSDGIGLVGLFRMSRYFNLPLTSTLRL